MGSGKNIKVALCEVLQFAGLCVPIFIVMQRFANIIRRIKTEEQPPGDGSTAYWLIVATSIAYVTSVALLVWVPMKYMVFQKRKFFTGRKKWRPVTLAYVTLSTLPCFAFLIASSEVQISNNMKYDTFTELPVSLVLFSLICIDIIERIRHCRLTGQGRAPPSTQSPIHTKHKEVQIITRSKALALLNSHDRPSFLCRVATLQRCTMLKDNNTHAIVSFPVTLPANELERDTDIPSTVLTHVAQVAPVTTVAGQVNDDREHIGASPRPVINGSVPGLPGNQERQFSISGLSSHTASTAYHLSPYAYSGPLKFLCASDMRAEIFMESFVFWFDTVEMDLPFLFIRIALIAIFGFVTPLLYLMKNLLVSLAFIYFNFITRLRMFNTERMF
ncbi:hypothetical protein AAFF_G00006880 [Aldrovandia affinis]|uniref:Transmembrane protein 236 n=1 Tax=Aldrovandia affinis TaxID=143900 RepID=A0AAD7X5Q8_9TELE|nr:hypothetical protein AAFF_G00006880 [Aldrovandia affinis]